MSLYLFIPPASAHPPSCCTGLITSELLRYWVQNSPTDFLHILVKFIERLYRRGHEIEHLTPLLLKAAAKIDQKQYIANTDKDYSQTLYIYWTYQPHGIQHHDLRQIYNNTLENQTSFQRMTITMAHPKKLRDIQSKSTLTLPENSNLHKMIQDIKTKVDTGLIQHNM
jgi:hypothetical protein